MQTATQQLAAWLATAILSWTSNSVPVAQTPGREEYVYDAAETLVHVFYAPREAPLFRGPAGRAHGALLLAAIDSMESGFREDVQEGRCRTNECDGGHAVCWGQIWPWQGIVLNPDGFRYYRGGEVGDDEDLMTREDLLDPELCLMTSMHMLRDSFRVTGSLRGYTGERASVMPKAEERIRRANRYFLLTPPPVLDAAVLEEQEPLSSSP